MEDTQPLATRSVGEAGRDPEGAYGTAERADSSTSWFRVNWRQAAGEASLVVFGILLAFWMNSYAERSRDRTEERRYLAALTEEFSRTRAELVGTIERLAETQAIAQQLIQLNSTDGSIEPDSLGRLISRFGRDAVLQSHHSRLRGP
jgi:hypothetical protein